MGKTLQECYEVLGLDNGATEDEIRSAYKQKALKCHPDKNPDDPLATQTFQELGHAYRRLMGDEDGDEDDDYGDEDDMELWRDFFFFLFRDEIMARVRCKCARCQRRGNEDDEFLASLAKEQEEKQQFTEEEMAQFTCFANLKEQREANKQRFCNKNLSSSKPEEKINKGNKPKLKSNKQLKHEQWKREKEITEMAAQMEQKPQVQEKASSRDSKKNDIPQGISLVHPEVVNTKHSVKEHSGAPNKRNTRKKRNRNKSRKQDNQEMGFNQNKSNKETTFAGQRVSSTFGIQDVIRNVTIKPETTRRQDDVTGRLPHASFTSSRMVRSSLGNSTIGSQNNAFQKQSERRWFENPKPGGGLRQSYSANIWEKRQQKQQFLAELQPCDQKDEELQLQMALELSKKQAVIDAQQREISILEEQMEKTLQIEKELQLKAVQNKARSITTSTSETNTAAVIDEDFPPLAVPLEYEQELDVEDLEEWVVASGSEEEWDSYACDSNSEGSEKCLAKCSDHEEDYMVKGLASKSEFHERDNMQLPKPILPLLQNPRDQNSQASDCPYGKNCCLGKQCKYFHPASIDTRKRRKSLDNSSSSQDQKVINSSKRNDDSSIGHNRAGKHNDKASCEKLPTSDTCDISYSMDNDGCSRTTSIPGLNESNANPSMQALQKETFTSGISTNSTHCVDPAIDKSENLNQHLGKEAADQDSQQLQEDECLSTHEEHQTNNTEVLTGSDLVKGLKSTSNTLCESSVPQDKVDVTDGSAPIPTVFVSEYSPISTNSPLLGAMTEAAVTDAQLASPSPAVSGLNQSANTMPTQPTNQSVNMSLMSQSSNTVPQVTNLSAESSALKQSANAMSQVTNLSAESSTLKQSATCAAQPPNLSVDAKVQNAPPTTQLEDSVKQLPAAGMQTNVVPLTSASDPQGSGNSPATSQNSTSSSTDHILQTSSASQQPNTPTSSIPAQPVAVNNFPQVPGLPLLPFSNLLPSLNPVHSTSFNQTINSSLMATAPLGGMPFPMMPVPYNGVQNTQGGGTVMNPLMVPPCYTNLAHGSALSPAYHLPPVALLNGFLGVPTGVDKQGVGLATNAQSAAQGVPQLNGVLGIAGTSTAQCSQAGLTSNPQSTVQAIPQLNGFLGMLNRTDMLGTAAAQLSQTELTNAQSTTISVPQLPLNGVPVGLNMSGTVANPQSASLNMSQLLRYPFPMVNPQAFVDVSTDVASMGIPNVAPQDGCQTTRSGTSQVERPKVSKPAEVKLGTAQEEMEGHGGIGTKAPLLRRPATVPKVIQHQVST